MLSGVQNVSTHVQAFHAYLSKSVRLDEQCKHRYIRKSGYVPVYLSIGEKVMPSKTLFGHSLHTISHYLRRVLRVVVPLSADIIKPHHAYNDGGLHYHPDPAQYLLFQVRLQSPHACEHVPLK